VSTSKPRITIVGLGLIGGSIGLALRQAEAASAIIGHDNSRPVAEEAKKLGAVDRVHWNLISACEESDLVILATPVGAIEETLEATGPYLRPGCVVLDTASIKGPVMDWAAKHLPGQVHFVGGDPILSSTTHGQWGIEAARADLFHRGLFCLVASPKAQADSVKLATDLVSILGAKPLFLDAAEHDGLLAAVEHLPAVLSLALLETVIHQPSWRELRKVAGSSFEAGTQLLSGNSLEHSELYLLNRENVLRWIDALTASLGSIRQALAEDQSEALVGLFEGAVQERQKWLADRTGGQWYEGPRTDMPPKPSMMDSLLGSFWRRKPAKED
jgi:prephenate dehydrogenase